MTTERLQEIEAKVRTLGVGMGGLLGKEIHELIEAVRRSVPVTSSVIVSVDKTFVPLLTMIMNAFNENRGFAVETYTTDGEDQTSVTFYTLGEK